jgi:hypothetical protein
MTYNHIRVYSQTSLKHDPILGAAYGDRHCIVNGLTTAAWPYIVARHEVSHLYGCGECTRTCIMNAGDVADIWCNPLLSRGCHNIMNDNKHKFD